MNNEEKLIEGKKKIMSLLDKSKFMSTKRVKEIGVEKGMYKNWSTYDRFLNILAKEGKVEKIETVGTIIWRKKK